MEQALPLLGALLVTLLVMAGAYLFTRWAGKRNFFPSAGVSRGNHLCVLDRLSLGRDQSILVVAVGERYLLLGSSSGGLSLLGELTRQEGEAWYPQSPKIQSSPPTMPDFGATLHRVLGKDSDKKR